MECSHKTYNIYCDESTHLENDGQPYMIYGYVSIPYNEMALAKKQIREIKQKHGYEEELKWTNISDKTFALYNEIVDYFFMTNMKFRAVIVDKSEIDNTRAEYSYNDFYFRMYYQLLHHQMDMDSTYNVYFDIKDTCSQRKLHKLAEILKYNSAIRDFNFVKSHQVHFIQLADILMGAINYHLRIQRGTIEGKVRAKRLIVEKIKRQTNLSLLCTVYRRDIEDNEAFKFREKRVYPIKSDGEIDMQREFMHLTTTDDKEAEGAATKKRVFEPDRSRRLHWIRHHIEERTSHVLEIFSCEERDMKHRKNIYRTYVYDTAEKYVIVLEPQRSPYGYYLLTAYYLNMPGGEKKMKKMLKKKLEEVL